SREAIVLELARTEGAVKLGADNVLHDASDIVHARRVLLALLCLLKHVADNSAQATGSVEPDLERLGREEFMHARNPEILDRIKVDVSSLFKLVQQGYILAHIADAAAACPATFSRQDAGDAVPVQNRLNRASTQT